ncbi:MULTISPECIES: hypothetical protein [Haloferax]|uniref:Lipoprotein n=1 Tax=Haloferax marinum TaxID=2666143 RepID=A0A6A8G7D8_9EURY|nr:MULTISPECIES: hypothetical protein [Haloferax]KAB1197159.1 hypothetical protein Hfx1150_06355 [Haloferax sp. CBA1150]MRW96193.1 hypothetical protein [Haloferax marinum]
MRGQLKTAALATVLLVLLAGCSAFSGFGFGQGGASESVTEEASGTNTVTPTIEQYETGSMVLNLAEMPGTYSLSGESKERLNESESQVTRFDTDGVRLRHERVFTDSSQRDDSPQAQLVFSAVAVFSDRESAKAGAENLVDSLEFENKQVSEADISAGVSGTRVTYRTDDGEYNTLLLDRHGRVVYFVVTSDVRGYRSDQATDLFKEMVFDVE